MTPSTDTVEDRPPETPMTSEEDAAPSAASVSTSSSIDENEDANASTAAPPPPPGVEEPPRGLKVLFLSSDTGGGHRASAESLARQFELLFPGSTYVLHDAVTSDGSFPYNQLVQSYKHLSAHPAQWKVVYSVSNSRAYEMIADVHMKLACERATRRRIMSYDPDLVVSVHPLMCNVPSLACNKISEKTGYHLPMFTVVTDLGSAHCLWFANTVDKMYVASDAVAQLAKERGKVPDEKLRKIGLPIRHDFAVQSKAMGDRMSPEGKAYQRKVREGLELPHTDRKTILVMGGGEGCGALGPIVDDLYVELVTRGIDALILVVCGRNANLKEALDTRNWDEVLDLHRRIREGGAKAAGMSDYLRDNCYPSARIPGQDGCIQGGVTSSLRKILSAGALENAVATPLPGSGGNSLAASDDGSFKAAALPFIGEAGEDNDDEPAQIEPETNEAGPDLAGIPGPFEEAEIPGKVTVVGLGFVTKMAEYMVAADVLVTKAGPGTIAEAASLSLPVMLTSFLPGQEEGNVDYVVDGEFGAFRSDADPSSIAEGVATWLNDEEEMARLSNNARKCGAPSAAAQIVREIGEEALRWRDVNSKRREKRASEEAERKRREEEERAEKGKEKESTLKRVGSYLQESVVPRLIPSYSSVSGAVGHSNRSDLASIQISSPGSRLATLT